MKYRIFCHVSFLMICQMHIMAQSFEEIYSHFKLEAQNNHIEFRNECNDKYIQFLRESWKWYEGKAPLPLPKEENTIPPIHFINKGEESPVTITPIDVEPIDNTPQPKPIEPIRETPTPDDRYFSMGFFGNKCEVRLPELAKLNLNDISPKSIANAWECLSVDGMNNTIRDCLETRLRYNLCDWAYLMFLDKLSKSYCSNGNGAILLMAFLYCQSGYQMRLAVDGNRLTMLYGSKHQIYDKPYFDLNGTKFYPYGDISKSISICDGAFEGETPLSLMICSEQMLGGGLSEPRRIESAKYKDISVRSQTPLELIEFFNQYPTSSLDNNLMTRWAMYANTPLSRKTKDLIYPALKSSIENCSEEEAANKLLNWVQTGFVYEYDDKVWGYDRAFFAEESLFYPYCDCEDRSILFSRLVRDLLGLDVALVYYPGHLATAVRFNNHTKGDAVVINGQEFIVCDPTYIGAPVGVQMPGLDYDKAKAIVLGR